jgi:hypothetical protein
MSDDRIARILRPSLALIALAAGLTLLGLAIAGPAPAATKASPSPASTRSGAVVLQRGAEVQFGNDVIVARGTRVPSVVVFGGDVRVEGTVTDAVVAFGGDVRIDGKVGTSTVAFGGDVTLGPNAVLGSALSPADASLVMFGGTLTKAPGARIVGQTKTFDAVGWNSAVAWAARGLLINPWWGFSLIGWLVQTAFFLVLALVAAALMPRQLRAVQGALGRKPWASLGWGALLVFLAVPAALVVLVISIIGLLLVLPYVVFVLLAYFFVTTGVAAFLAQKVLTGFGGRENLMLAVTVGVVGTTVVSRIPVAGPVLLCAMMIFGAGAAALAFADWRREQREAAVVRAANAAAAAAATGAAAYPSSTASDSAPAATITPLVSTAPDAPVGAAAVASHAAAPRTAVAEPASGVAGSTAVTEAAPAVTAAAAVAQAPAAPDEPEAPAAPPPPAADDTGLEGG